MLELKEKRSRKSYSKTIRSNHFIQGHRDYIHSFSPNLIEWNTNGEFYSMKWLILIPTFKLSLGCFVGTRLIKSLLQLSRQEMVVAWTRVLIKDMVTFRKYF